jgi:NADH:ubiquinone oxidoreductase subunit F (NADH-binding)
VCTVTGRTRRHGVGEVRMGTPLGEVIEAVGGGVQPGRQVKAVLSGVANGVIPGSLLDTPVSYEGLNAIGSGLGSGSFIVMDDTVDMAAVAAGVARFLAIESCGQCSPCKLDGITLADRLAKVVRLEGQEHDLNVIRKRIGTVADRSRCYLATQQQAVLESILRLFPEEMAARVAGDGDPAEPELIAELLDIRGGRAYLDERHRQKQPDWTYNKHDSGTVPVERYTALTPPWRG